MKNEKNYTFHLSITILSMHLNVLKPIQLNGRKEFTLYFVHSVHCGHCVHCNKAEWLSNVTVVVIHRKYTTKDHCQAYLYVLLMPTHHTQCTVSFNVLCGIGKYILSVWCSLIEHYVNI